MNTDDIEHLPKAGPEQQRMHSTDARDDSSQDFSLPDEDVRSVAEGLAIEQIDFIEPGINRRTFDPSRIRISSHLMSLDILIRRMQDGRLSIPAYSHTADAWSNAKKSSLIESILIRIPLPTFYIDSSEDDRWKIIDGLQRLKTLRQFLIDKQLRLSQLEFLDLEGKGYDDLPLSLQRRISETQVSVHFVQEGTPLEVIYNIYKRINRGGEALATQEIRNAIHQGVAVEVLERLAKSEAFLQATGRSIGNLRCADQEVVLRFFAFLMTPEKWSHARNIDAFMNEAMLRLGNMSSAQVQHLEGRFIRAVNAAWLILAERAFRELLPSGRHGKVSRSLFDAWCRNLDDLTDLQIDRLSQHLQRSNLLASYMDLLADDTNFHQSITCGTGDPVQVQYRYEAIRRIIHQSLHS